jgi:hypothetical protein
VKHNEFHTVRSTIARLTLLLVFLGMPFTPALAVDLSALDGWRSLLPTHAGWTLLAGLGLVAVAVAALTLRRHRSEVSREDEPLGRMRDDPETRLPAVSPPERAPAIVAPPFVPVREQGPVRVAETSLPAVYDTLDTPVAVPASGSHLFLALHHVDLSIDVLRKHLQRESRPMPAVWLMLLDLCRTHAREQTFRELALEFHRRFNVCTPAWDGFPPGRDDPGLEAYPRLVKEITLAWGTHECRRLLDRLLYDNRGSQRKGFTLNAYNDLIALRRAADAVLETIEQDLAEEAKVRSAFASASADMGPASLAPAHPGAAKSPLVSDLESQLDDDLRADMAPQSAIEREHPALAGMLAREWGNAAMSARLCEMLARGGDSTHRLSNEASEEIELLHKMAERLCAANGINPT